MADEATTSPHLRRGSHIRERDHSALLEPALPSHSFCSPTILPCRGIEVSELAMPSMADPEHFSTSMFFSTGAVRWWGSRLRHFCCRLLIWRSRKEERGRKNFLDVEEYEKLVVGEYKKKERFRYWNNLIAASIIPKAGQYHGKHTYDDFWSQPSTSLDAQPEHEDEDYARALANSLSDEERKGKTIDNRPDLEEDEQLARAVEESWNIEHPSHQNVQNYPPYPSFFPSFSRRCAGCNKEVGHGRYLNAAGSVWHPDCFRCHECNRPISDHEFSMNGNHPYHKSCYRKLYHPKCDVCKEFIPAIRDGRIEYRAHPFWQQRYCPSHEHDGTPRCCSCERMETRDAKYFTLDDGRKLCLECLHFAVMDTNECQPLYLDIQEFYEGLNMKLEQQIPMLLVERQALNEAMEGEKNWHHHLPETRGLCLSEEQIVRTVLRRPIKGPGYRLIDMVTGPFRVIRRCEVTAILVLYGLPRLLTGSILAHEMMHGWLRLKGYRSLDPEVEEGICQVLGHMWLDSEIISGAGSVAASTSSSSSSSRPTSKKGARTQAERKLGEFFKHQIESDVSLTYGDGFRAANGAVEKYGLKPTLDHIKYTGSIP